MGVHKDPNDAAGGLTKSFLEIRLPYVTLVHYPGSAPDIGNNQLRVPYGQKVSRLYRFLGILGKNSILETSKCKIRKKFL